MYVALLFWPIREATETIYAEEEPFWNWDTFLRAEPNKQAHRNSLRRSGQNSAHKMSKSLFPYSATPDVVQKRYKESKERGRGLSDERMKRGQKVNQLNRPGALSNYQWHHVATHTAGFGQVCVKSKTGDEQKGGRDKKAGSGWQCGISTLVVQPVTRSILWLCTN